MEQKELLNTMEKCGHFLYHRLGMKRGQLKVLKLLYEKESITQKELLTLLTLRSGSVSETVKKLETQGFITKNRDKKDKRKINLSLTKEGKDFLEKQLAINEEQEKVLFTALNTDEQAKLQNLLEKLLEDWQSKFDLSLFNHKGGSNNGKNS